MDWYTLVADLLNWFTISWKVRLKKEKKNFQKIFLLHRFVAVSMDLIYYLLQILWVLIIFVRDFMDKDTISGRF